MKTNIMSRVRKIAHEVHAAIGRGSRAAILLVFPAAAAFAGTPLATSQMLGHPSPNDWPSYGRTSDEGHYSPLTQINRTSVGKLGLVWSVDLPGIHNGATVPLAVAGIIYFTVDQSLVHAVDVRTGKLLWRFDPHVAAAAGKSFRYGWGSRGLAFWNGRLYVGTTDGRLIALDSRNGAVLWSRKTTEGDDGRYITGAPRVFDGKVIIGHGGADYNPVRGYVTTYDATSGKELWRFYTVPGDPAQGFESDAMRMAAATWHGKWWEFGGGGTVWNAITYDSELHRIYLGTGNGTPWNQHVRSPGGGDNLFVCSIVALDADTGRYLWHYQINPGESWDYNAAMDITLATVRIGALDRRVILHAPKNGFFYVLDRDTGKLLSAEKFAKVTWAERIDMSTGRPVEMPGIRYDAKPAAFWPGAGGAHNWQPMSFSPRTGLVYIPAIDMPGYYSDTNIDRAQWHFSSSTSNNALDDITGGVPPNVGTSSLLAWDPALQRAAWKAPTPGIWNGGTLATAGDLVFEGQGDGQFKAYDALSGAPLWSFNAGMGISGAPISFAAGGRQFITVVAGWGGIGATYLGAAGAANGWASRQESHRLLVFALDGRTTLPPARAKAPVRPLDDAAFDVDSAKADAGAVFYARTCIVCHGAAAVGAGYAPDLRASPVTTDSKAFASVVRDGILKTRGMPPFGEITDTQLDDLRHYIRQRARSDLNNATAAAHP